MCYYKCMDINKARKVRAWRRTLDELAKKDGVTLEDLCEYTGLAYNGKETAIYKKLPKKRTAFIGAGMAHHQPVEVINDWIQTFGGKKKLYVKDISEDLVWIYLIEANAADRDSGKNYFRLYEKCQAVTHATWKELWDELTMDPEETADVEMQLEDVDYDDDFEGLRTFVIDHMDSFKVAYSKPRRMLDSYVELILDAFRRAGKPGMRGLTDLRGWLDDSMINYIAGDSKMITVIDKKSRRKTVKIKYVPKNKRIHISMCLALGMGRSEIDEYLRLMGFAPLSEDDEREGCLIEMLEKWDEKYPLATSLRAELKEGERSILETNKRQQAAEEMLMLRQDLREMYEKQGLEFPYLREHRDGE